MNRGAFIDGDYRYWLTRVWRPGGDRVTFVGLNPSTADGMTDDPTIRKCVGFASRWGFGKLLMLNLFTYRATDPKELRTGKNLIGDGDHYWDGFNQIRRGELVVCCWGSKEVKGFEGRPAYILKTLKENGAKLRALELNKNGSPKHPLYIGYSKKLVHYRGVTEGAMR